MLTPEVGVMLVNIRSLRLSISDSKTSFASITGEFDSLDLEPLLFVGFVECDWAPGG